jgi:AraC-like DNA-binding protein
MPPPPPSTQGILEPGSAATRFVLTRTEPSPDLRDHVERHWVVRWALPEGEPFVQEILPHPCVNLAGEPGLIAVHGIPLGRSSHRLEGSGVVVGTKFRPGGLRGFLASSVSDLNGRTVAPGELLGSAGERLERDLAALAGDPDAHVAAVEAFLRDRLPAPDPRFALVRRAVTDALVLPPGTTVAQLDRRHGVSARTLQRLFGDYVGVGPKWVLKRYRVHQAAERIAAGEAHEGASLALELGYFDQSHFIGDFTAQVGRSPGAYARDCAAARHLVAA